MTICEYCDKNLKTSRGLRIHISKFHSEKESSEFKCKICHKNIQSLKGLMGHIKKIHNNVEEYFNRYIDIKCKFCNKRLEHATKFGNDFCCQAHSVAFKNMEAGHKLNFSCEVCKSRYVDLRQLGHHISCVHRDVDIEKYYTEHYKKSDSEGKCKWCEAPTKFISLSKGYTNFCYNTNCNVLWYNKNTNRHTDSGPKISKDHLDHPEKMSMNVEYWIAKGYSPEEAKMKRSERQTTFSKKICIEKHGPKKGLDVWKKRQVKWQDTINTKSPEQLREINRRKAISLENMIVKYGEVLGKQKYKHWISSTQFVSASSVAFFRKLEEKMERNDFIYGDRGEHDCETGKYFYDFTDLINKKVIEYNGDFWHANPIKYEKKDLMKFPNHKIKPASEIWENDRVKNQLAIDNGYSVLVIWESEVKEDTDKILNKCIEFLNG